MRAAERRQEVIERHLVRQVDDGEAQVPFVAISAENIVLSHGKVEKIARQDALWIVIVVLSSGCGHFYFRGRELRSRAKQRQWSGRGGAHAVATHASLKFLIGGK